MIKRYICTIDNKEVLKKNVCSHFLENTESYWWLN